MRFEYCCAEEGTAVRAEDGGDGDGDGGGEVGGKGPAARTSAAAAGSVRVISPLMTTPSAGELAAAQACKTSVDGSGSKGVAVAAEVDAAYTARFLGNWCVLGHGLVGGWRSAGSRVCCWRLCFRCQLGPSSSLLHKRPRPPGTQSS